MTKDTRILEKTLEWALWEYYIRILKQTGSVVKAKEEAIRKCVTILQTDEPQAT